MIMKNILNCDLYINPLYMDTLSGEFQATATPEKLHTLGRLAILTFHKGIQVEPTLNDKDLVGRIGEISTVKLDTSEFGSAIESKLLLRADHRLPVMQLAAGIILTKSDAAISFVHLDHTMHTVEEDQLRIRASDLLANGDPIRETQYELPVAVNDIDTARTFATTMAQGFVN